MLNVTERTLKYSNEISVTSQERSIKFLIIVTNQDFSIHLKELKTTEKQRPLQDLSSLSASLSDCTFLYFLAIVVSEF